MGEPSAPSTSPLTGGSRSKKLVPQRRWRSPPWSQHRSNQTHEQSVTARLELPDAAIAAAYRAGATIDQLAADYGVSTSSIRRRLREQQVPLRPPGRRPGPLDE